jgi:hypothetical protein
VSFARTRRRLRRDRLLFADLGDDPPFKLGVGAISAGAAADEECLPFRRDRERTMCRRRSTIPYRTRDGRDGEPRKVTGFDVKRT